MKIFSGKKLSFLLGAALLLTACQTSTIEVKPKASQQMVDATKATKGYYNLGKTYLAQGDYGLAIESFRQDIDKNGPSIQTLNGMGVTYDMLGRHDISQMYYNKALEIDPKSPVTFSNLAYSQHIQGEDDNAEKLASVAKELFALKNEVKVASAETVTKIVEKNRAIFKEAKKENKITEKKVVEKTGLRSWEIVKKKVESGNKTMPKYKSKIAIEQIIAEAREGLIQEKPVKIAEKEKNGIKKVAAATGGKLVYSISNGTGRPQMAKRISKFLGKKGVPIQSVVNARYFGHEKTVVRFAPGYKAEAQKLAKVIPAAVELKEDKSLKDNVELTLGADLLTFDTSLFNKKSGKSA